MVSPDALAAWCRRWLGAEPRRSLFELRQLSCVVGLELADGRSVVVKARPPIERLTACVMVQRRLWERGYPCPQPLAGPAPLGDLAATAESYQPAGDPLPRNPDSPRRFAEALAALVAAAPDPTTLPSLDPAPPWVGWNHDQPGTWPLPDNLDADLNAVDGPAWIDDAAQHVRALLLASALPLVVGHADWESQNLRWQNERLVAVHDWDSVVVLPEAAIAGAAAAVFPADRQPLSDANVAESEAFLTAYAATRGRPWSDEERCVGWAAGLWVRLFNAKKAVVRDPASPVVDRLAGEIDARLAVAGLL